jgi:hypothetical protein
MNPPQTPRRGVLASIGRCFASLRFPLLFGLLLALPLGGTAEAAGFGFREGARWQGAARWVHPARPRTGPWANARGPFGAGAPFGHGPFGRPGGPYAGRPGFPGGPGGPFAGRPGPIGGPGGPFAAHPGPIGGPGSRYAGYPGPFGGPGGRSEHFDGGGPGGREAFRGGEGERGAFGDRATERAFRGGGGGREGFRERTALGDRREGLRGRDGERDAFRYQNSEHETFHNRNGEREAFHDRASGHEAFRNRLMHGPTGGWHNFSGRNGDGRLGSRNPEFHNGEFRNSNARYGIVRPGFFMPPTDERRFVGNEVVLDLPSDVSAQTLSALAQRHHLTRVGAQSLGLTGHTLYRWRVEDSRPIGDVLHDLQSENQISAAQPNFTFTLQDQGKGSEPREGDPAQYAVAKLQLSEAHRLATGDHVMVAVIDSAIDIAQPELKGDIVASFDAVGGVVTPHPHGTAMAGAIGAHGRLIGVAPRVKLLAVRAFGESANAPQATTFNIIRGLDWAVIHGARVVNMSFAGPEDPVLKTALDNAHKKGVVLVAAAGNAGPKSLPLYPAANQNVIAVTATDANDQVFAQANRGSYIAVAAPGVDILVPAPNAGEQLTSGTSVSAAQVSGIVALLLERNPALTPDEARNILISTATPLAQKPRENDSGAGLANAWRAVTAVGPKAAAQIGADR